MDKNNKLKQKYINPVSHTSIHLLWEPLILILINRITQCKIKREYKVNLKKSLDKFIVEKKQRNEYIKYNNLLEMNI